MSAPASSVREISDQDLRDSAARVGLKSVEHFRPRALRQHLEGLADASASLTSPGWLMSLATPVSAIVAFVFVAVLVAPSYASVDASVACRGEQACPGALHLRAPCGLLYAPAAGERVRLHAAGTETVVTVRRATALDARQRLLVVDLDASAASLARVSELRITPSRLSLWSALLRTRSQSGGCR